MVLQLRDMRAKSHLRSGKKLDTNVPLCWFKVGSNKFMRLRTMSLVPMLLKSPRRERRRDEINSIQQLIGEGFAESLIGQELDVLVDGYNDDGFLIGRTQVRPLPGRVGYK